MAVSLSVFVKKRWWVRPYMWTLSAFAAAFSFFMDEDDLRTWLEWEVEWIVKRGIKFQLLESKCD